MKKLVLALIFLTLAGVAKPSFAQDSGVIKVKDRHFTPEIGALFTGVYVDTKGNTYWPCFNYGYWIVEKKNGLLLGNVSLAVLIGKDEHFWITISPIGWKLFKVEGYDLHMSLKPAIALRDGRASFGLQLSYIP